METRRERFRGEGEVSVGLAKAVGARGCRELQAGAHDPVRVPHELGQGRELRIDGPVDVPFDSPGQADQVGPRGLGILGQEGSYALAHRAIAQPSYGSILAAIGRSGHHHRVAPAKQRQPQREHGMHVAARPDR